MEVTSRVALRKWLFLLLTFYFLFLSLILNWRYVVLVVVLWCPVGFVVVVVVGV